MTYKQRIHDVFLDSLDEIIEIENADIRQTALLGVAETLKEMTDDLRDACNQSLRAEYPLIIITKG